MPIMMMMTKVHLKFFIIILWQEFGDSARARKLYIDDESEEEEELEPNPKLGAGQHADEEVDGGQHVVQFDGDYVNDDDDCDSHRDNENHMNIVNETLNMVECKQDIASAPNPTLPRRPTLMFIDESESAITKIGAQKWKWKC